MSESSWTDIFMLTDDDVKELDAKTDEFMENEFVTGLFICMADIGRYDKLKT